MKRAGWMITALLLATAAAVSAQTTTHRKPSAGHVTAKEVKPATAEPTPEPVKAPARKPAEEPTSGTMHVTSDPPPVAPVETPAEAPLLIPATAPVPVAPASAGTRPQSKVEQAQVLDHLLLPVGTLVRMKLETLVSTVTSKRGDSFAGRVTYPVVVNGKTVIPVGASVEGRVAMVDEPRRIRGVPVIDMRPETVTMPDGKQFAMSATVIDTSDPGRYTVDEEGRVKGSGWDDADKRETMLGAGGGLAIGALAVHSFKGAMIGAAVGTGATLVHWLTKPHSEVIPAGTELFLELSRPMTLSGATGR